MDELIPPKFKLPQLELYNQTINPTDHLKHFKTLMLLHGATNNRILYQAFPSTLQKVAQN